MVGMELTERGGGGRGIYTGIFSPLLVLHCRTLGILHERWVYTYLGSVMASMREGVERGMDPGGAVGCRDYQLVSQLLRSSFSAGTASRPGVRLRLRACATM